MALTKLNQIQKGALPQVVVYSPAPTSSYSNPTTPETEVNFTILGYLASNNNVMLFEVSDSDGTASTLVINTNTSSDAITVTDTTNQVKQTVVTYYTVDFGFDTSINSWTLNFNITLKDGTTGSWVFTKKGVGEDTPV